MSTSTCQISKSTAQVPEVLCTDTHAGVPIDDPHLGLDDVMDAWSNDPLFYPARSGDPSKCRPIGCYEASSGLAATYRRDRDEH